MANFPIKQPSFNLFRMHFTEDIYKPKLFYADITQRLNFCICKEVMFCNNTTYSAETELPAPFLPWGQRQRHTNTDMGSLDCKSADNSSVKKHQEALCILAGCYHGTTYAHVLRRFYRIHGKSRKNLD